ncbi:hypothetical protein [Moorella sulfitireducens (nom. illeg.)]|uniref:hypothetical protein n=1 Tax=Neomoorella sulfitireducens TaxID=2972948 RepID=UPI0021AC1ED4|nr:hypothetical protein [Moorella sulfitireducens]
MPVHVQVSKLVLIPESEIIVMNLPGQPPVTVYYIGPAQIEKVEEYFAGERKLYSPWRKGGDPVAQKRRHRSGNKKSRQDTGLLRRYLNANWGPPQRLRPYGLT